MKICNACKKKIRQMEKDLLRPEPKAPRVRQNPTRWFTGLEGYGAPDGLLTTTSAKTVLGESLGYLSGVLYMLPVQRLEEVMMLGERGVSRCAAASAGCAGGCLIVSGQGGGVNSNVLKRARKTWLYEHDRKWFMAALERSITKVVTEAARKSLVDPITGEKRSFIPCIRLNGTTDIRWERPQAGVRIMDLFPNVMFYDYTKWPLSKRTGLPDNYDLTFSYSDNKGSAKQAQAYLESGRNVAVVWRTLAGVVDVIEEGSWKAKGWKRAYPVINGDRDDLRFLDPHPCVVALFAKVSMIPDVAAEQRADPFGFFMERLPEEAAAEGWLPPPPNAVDPQSPTPASVWKARCMAYKTVCVPDPRDPLGERKIKIKMVSKTSIPYDRPLHATQIAKRKKKWTKAFYGDSARHLTPEGEQTHLMLVNEALGGGYRLDISEGYRHGDARIERQRRGSRLTSVDEVIRRISHNSAPIKRWMAEHTPGKFDKLMAVEKRIRSKTAANIKRRKGDQISRQNLLVAAYMDMHGIEAAPQLQAAGKLAGSLLQRRNPVKRKNPTISWKKAARKVFDVEARKAEERSMTPRNPMELAFGEGAFDGWSRVGKKLIKESHSMRSIRNGIAGAFEAAQDKYASAERESDVEGMAYYDGLSTALEKMDDVIVKLSRQSHVRSNPAPAAAAGVTGALAAAGRYLGPLLVEEVLRHSGRVYASACEDPEATLDYLRSPAGKKNLRRAASGAWWLGSLPVAVVDKLSGANLHRKAVSRAIAYLDTPAGGKAALRVIRTACPG
jgi:hypothetical protein